MKTKSVHHMPFVIAVDRRECPPHSWGGYRFEDIQGTFRYDSRKLTVDTETVHLKTGDYTIQGYEDLVTVERKTLDDLYNTLGQGRDRFKRQHERMATMIFAVVVIEATAGQIRYRPPSSSAMNPVAVYQTMLSWVQRYGVPWIPADNKRLAEETTFWLLEKFWRQRKSLEAL